MDNSAVFTLREFEERFPIMLNTPVVVEDPIKCIVGRDEALYLVPKALLVSRCPTFFGPALESQFCEAKTKTLVLPEEDPEIFELFIHWASHGAIAPLVAEDDSDGKDEYAVAREAKYHCLYYLGEKWSIKALKNCVMDSIRAYHTDTDSRIHPTLINDCFQWTPTTSPLRRYVVESAAFVIKSCRGKEYMQQLQEEISSTVFLFELLKKLSGLIDMGSFDDPNLKADCDFHEETQGGQCCAITNDFQGDKRLKGYFHKVFVMD